MAQKPEPVECDPCSTKAQEARKHLEHANPELRAKAHEWFTKRRLGVPGYDPEGPANERAAALAKHPQAAPVVIRMNPVMVIGATHTYACPSCNGRVAVEFTKDAAMATGPVQGLDLEQRDLRPKAVPRDDMGLGALEVQRDDVKPDDVGSTEDEFSEGRSSNAEQASA